MIQNTLKYKKPHLVHAANTREDFCGNLFVYPSFFPVGKHEYIVRTPGPNPNYMFSTTITDIRLEEVAECK